MLTDRERLILAQLAEGKTYKQLAYDSHMSYDVARAYGHFAMKKLGAKTITQAVAMVERMKKFIVD